MAGRAAISGLELVGDPERLRLAGDAIVGVVAPVSVHWGAWGPYALAIAALLEGRYDEAIANAEAVLERVSAGGERRLEWRAGRVAWLALAALGRDGDADRFRKEASARVEEEAAHASGRLRESFLARPDVAELLA